MSIALLAPVSAFPQAKGGKSAVYEQLNLFDEAFERIRQDAVEPVGDNRLVATAITGMLQAMDPHAVYLSEAEVKAQAAPTPEQSGSAGLVVTIEGGQLQVVSPRDGSPAADAGIKPGDAIYMIDKEPTYDLSLGDVEQRLRGPVDSEVKLLVRRGTAAPSEITVKRAAAEYKTITSHLETGTIGYIRIAGFDAKTADDLASAVKDLRQQSGDRLIGFVLDLRNDPGGNFDAAVATADALIDKGDIAVVKGRKADSTKHIAATPGDLASGLPIVAIVNGGTAREAELVAGALQDDHRAVLLGTKTFGESAIESTIPIHRQRGDPADHRALPDPGGPCDPGQGHPARPFGRPAQDRAHRPRRDAPRGRSARRPEEHRPGRPAWAAARRRNRRTSPRRRAPRRAPPAPRHRAASRRRDPRHRHRRGRAANRGLRRLARAVDDERQKHTLTQHPLRGSAHAHSGSRRRRGRRLFRRQAGQIRAAT